MFVAFLLAFGNLLFFVFWPLAPCMVGMFLLARIPGWTFDPDSQAKSKTPKKQRVLYFPKGRLLGILMLVFFFYFAAFLGYFLGGVMKLGLSVNRLNFEGGSIADLVSILFLWLHYAVVFYSPILVYQLMQTLLSKIESIRNSDIDESPDFVRFLCYAMTLISFCAVSLFVGDWLGVLFPFNHVGHSDSEAIFDAISSR